MTYHVEFAPRARRQIEHTLPEAVAVAALEFIRGSLRENPQRVGKRLSPPKAHLHAARLGTYRILYSINEEVLLIVVVTIDHRRDAYRA